MLDAPSTGRTGHLKSSMKAWHRPHIWKGKAAGTSGTLPWCQVQAGQLGIVRQGENMAEVDSIKDCSFLREHNEFTTFSEKPKITASIEDWRGMLLPTGRRTQLPKVACSPQQIKGETFIRNANISSNGGGTVGLVHSCACSI